MLQIHAFAAGIRPGDDLDMPIGLTGIEGVGNEWGDQQLLQRVSESLELIGNMKLNHANLPATILVSPSLTIVGWT